MVGVTQHKGVHAWPGSPTGKDDTPGLKSIAVALVHTFIRLVVVCMVPFLYKLGV